MSLQNGIRSLSLPAGADLSASQFCFVSLNTSGQVILPASAGNDCVGVLQDKPNAAGMIGEVAMLNSSLKLKVVAGGNVTAGDKLQATTAGKAITAATGKHVVGTALQTGVLGDLIEFLPSSRMLLP